MNTETTDALELLLNEWNEDSAATEETVQSMKHVAAFALLNGKRVAILTHTLFTAASVLPQESRLELMKALHAADTDETGSIGKLADSMVLVMKALALRELATTV